MKPLFAIPLLCLVASCGSGEAASLAPQAPCPADGRQVELFAWDAEREVFYDYSGGLVGWTDSWVSLKLASGRTAHIQTAFVRDVEEMYIP